MADLICVTFLRHGRSRADDEGVLEGRYDSPLTETGQAQAKLRGEGWLKQDVHFDRVICSTMQRARATAGIVAGILNVPLETDPDWMEVDTGPLAGMTFSEAEARYPRPAFRNPYEAICGTGESEVDLHIRAARAVQNLVRRGPGRYLVVAHGGILNCALREIIGAPYPVNKHGIWFAFQDLGYARFTYAPNAHRWVMQELGY